MTEPTTVISIDRTGMAGSPAPLTFSATPGVGELGIVNYREPALQPRVRYAPSADDIHGEQPLAWSWQQSILSWDVVTDDCANEAESRALVAEIRAAISRLSYLVTVTVNGATPEVWTCVVGEANYTGDRTYADLTDSNPVIGVSLPCNPVRS